MLHGTAMSKRLLGVVLIIVLTLTVSTSAWAQDTTHEFTLQTHPALDMPEQDVFVMAADSSDEVMRLGPEAAMEPDNRAMDGYAAAQPIEHDPFMLGENPLGPFPAGEALGFTMGEWLDGEATGTYTVSGDSATLEISGSNLVANGVYTVWCSRIKMPPDPEVSDYPCGAADGSENTMTTDANGSGTFSVTMDPLPESDDVTKSVVALAYHSDGNTYGADPGEFGHVTHVQLVHIMPTPAEMTDTTQPEALPSTGAGPSSHGLVAWLAALLLATGLWLRRRFDTQPT